MNPLGFVGLKKLLHYETDYIDHNVLHPVNVTNTNSPEYINSGFNTQTGFGNTNFVNYRDAASHSPKGLSLSEIDSQGKDRFSSAENLNKEEGDQTIDQSSEETLVDRIGVLGENLGSRKLTGAASPYSNSPFSTPLHHPFVSNPTGGINLSVSLSHLGAFSLKDHNFGDKTPSPTNRVEYLKLNKRHSLGGLNNNRFV